MQKVVLVIILLVSLGLTQSVNFVLAANSPRCFSNSVPKFNGSVDVHFFNSKHHSPETYGCGPNLQLRFDIQRSISNSYSQFQDLVLDNKDIQRDLIDSDEFNPKLDTYFFIHGFFGTWTNNPVYCSIKDLVLNNTEANFFLVDWSSGSIPEGGLLNYAQSVIDTEYVGQLLARFILSLMRQTGQSNADKYHVIGHSLGAQASGFVGYTLGSRNKLGRITALDPAGPCFTVDDKTSLTFPRANEIGILPGDKRRLSASSAKLVVALHTDSLGLGVADNVGHYDVFVNGGTQNPACRAQNPPIACDHFYSTQVLNTFARLVVDQQEYRAFSPNTTGPSQCFPMAFTCRSWNAFKTGECGACKDGDTKCIFMGLGNNRQGITTSFSATNRANDTNNYQEASDDRRFNNENPLGTIPKDEVLSNNASRLSYLFSKDRQYIITGNNTATCRYTYQVVITTSNTVNAIRSKKFYLQIPLGSDANLIYGREGSAIGTRLVRVSNPISFGSEGHQRLSDEMQIAQDQRATLTYYTALISFGQDNQGCRTGVNVTRDGWQLCQPLTTPLTAGARLWSSDATQLSSVRSVALNYMSGLTERSRADKSFVASGQGNNIVQVGPSERPTLVPFEDVSDFERFLVTFGDLNFAMRL